MKGPLQWLLVGALALAAWQTYRLSQERLAHAQTERAHAEQIGTLERAARAASEQYRTKEHEWALALGRIGRDAETQIGKARSAAAVADAAAVGLRADYARAVAAYRDLAASTAADANAGPATDQAGDLLANVFGRIDQAAGDIARYADEAGFAGQACWAAGQALNE